MIVHDHAYHAGHRAVVCPEAEHTHLRGTERLTPKGITTCLEWNHVSPGRQNVVFQLPPLQASFYNHDVIFIMIWHHFTNRTRCVVKQTSSPPGNNADLH